MADTYEAFYNGKPLNPNRGLPTMTYAQAEASGLTESERLWCRTDGEDTPITADDIPYDSNNSVKDKIDDTNNKINARFDIINGGGASNANLTGLTAGKVYIHVSSGGGQNFPTNGGGYLQTFLNPNTTSYGRQMYYSNDGVFTRKLQGGSWGSWTTISN